ncbi:hypothetical protein D3C78_1906280 [compost metagenome]
MADLLAGLGRLLFFMQLPGQVQQLAAKTCAQGIQRLALPATSGYPMPVCEQLFHQRQA